MTTPELHTHRSAFTTPLSVPEPTIRILLASLGHDDGGDATIGTLHTAICERVRAMRDAGDPPEAVLARVKRLTAAALNDGDASRGARQGDATAVVAQVGQWCIAEYFRRT